MTIAEKFKQVLAEYGSHTAVAFLVDDEYKKVSYNQLNNYRLRIAHTWKKYGWKKEEKVAVMLPNSLEWIISDLAAATLGLVFVPIHTTFSEEYIKKVIQHSGAKYLVIHVDFLAKHEQAIKALNLEKIVMVGKSYKIPNKVEQWPFLEEEKEVEDIKDQVSDDSLHTLIYTSGTTGDPKGVMLSHRNLVINVDSAKRIVPIAHDDRFFSFLPLSHAFERTAGYYAAIFSGASIYFARSTQTIIDDIKKAKPTIINSVPRIFERIYGKVFDKIENGSTLKKKMFFKGLKLAVLKRKNQLKWWEAINWFLLDVIVLNKIRAIFGGRLRMAISGGASLDLKIIRFFDNLGLQLIEGYGLTETSPIIAVNSLENSRFGTVGHALDCNQIKISDKKEILVKGENVMLGYYQNQAMTDEIIHDGWINTGDLGFIDKEGFLTIVGRAKDVIVLSTGKNIFPEGIENVLNESRYIYQSMIYGDNDKYISAFIVPNFEQLKKWCKKHKIKFDLSDEKINNFYQDKIEHRLRKSSKIEQIASFKLLSEEFAQDNGLLTPTLKLKRYKILNKYK
ncbi:long-chain fatty acid--CoA ligase [Candidatus Parcubacteria bacterium]|jgi:long-chain acyl-CoA synthetase|nr:long-chain fatty acid--CoA ligase [Candidatus Parcubacteria bacterium]